jgi:hypothetical protein
MAEVAAKLAACGSLRMGLAHRPGAVRVRSGRGVGGPVVKDYVG